MIADRATEIEVQSTVQGESVGMTFDENSLVHLMSVLTDLYSDPEMAVIREYATNALDAHIEAGQSRPIEVSLPSELSPFYKTKDYGVGLDFEDIVQIYSKYGASTKRDTNDQVGMLGLGCKSALTYTSQFSLIGIKNNIRTTVSVSRNEEGAGSMTLVEQVPTVEPNGVEVIVPVKRYHLFKTKVAEFFSYWKPGTVLVDGVHPDHIDGLKVGENIFVVSAHRYREDKIVMGGVAYPAEFSNIKLRSGSGSVVAYVNVGDIHFTPSREALSMTTKTKATIANIEEYFAQGIQKVIEESIQNTKNRFEALRVASEWRAMLGDDAARVRYQGSKVPIVLDAPNHEEFRTVAMKSRNLSDSSRDHRLPASLAVNALWVHDFWATKFTASQKKRLVKYAEQKGIDGEITHFVLTNKPVKHLWIDPDRRASWEEVRKITLPRDDGGAASHNQVAGTYEAWQQGRSWLVTVKADEIDTNEPLIYFVPNTHEFYGEWEEEKARKLAFKYHPTVTIAKVPSHRVDKFKRLFPTAVRLKDFIGELQQKAAAQVPKAHRIHLAHSKDMRCLAKLDAKRVKDPALRKAIRIAHEDVSASWSLISELSDLRMGVNLTSDLDWKNPLDKYPLFNNDPYTRVDEIEDHLYTYFNAIYALTEEGN